MFAGNIPVEIFSLVSRICGEQEMVSEGIAQRNIDMILNAFVNNKKHPIGCFFIFDMIVVAL